MRLWTIHPRYLDRRGLVALWREGLLAQSVLAGRTRGYHRHPQLERFKKTRNPVASIGAYLVHVAHEAGIRNYKFDHSKILKPKKSVRIKVTRGQIQFELIHLLKKLKLRDPSQYRRLTRIKALRAHPVFEVMKGPIETWEKGGP